MIDVVFAFGGKRGVRFLRQFAVQGAVHFPGRKQGIGVVGLEANVSEGIGVGLVAFPVVKLMDVGFGFIGHIPVLTVYPSVEAYPLFVFFIKSF